MDLERGQQPATKRPRTPSAIRSRAAAAVTLESVLAAGIEILPKAATTRCRSPPSARGPASPSARSMRGSTARRRCSPRCRSACSRTSTPSRSRCSPNDLGHRRAIWSTKPCSELATHFHRKEALLRVMIMRGAVDEPRPRRAGRLPACASPGTSRPICSSGSAASTTRIRRSPSTWPSAWSTPR